MDKIIFYYDEAEHSRKLTKETIEAENFVNEFYAAIVGLDDTKKVDFEETYGNFEEKYKKLYTISGELKSRVIKQNKYKYGLVSLKPMDMELISELMDLIMQFDLRIYFCVFNKLEYIIIQLLNEYRNNLFLDADSLKYSISKLITLYKPERVIESIYTEDNSFLVELRKFIVEVRKKNKAEGKRELETEAIEQMLIILDEISEEFCIDWNYDIAFGGFDKYLTEEEIKDYALIIDKEGDGATLRSAQKVGIINSCEADSMEEVGLRMADFVVGILSSFIKAIHNGFDCGPTEKTKHLQFLHRKWFEVDETKLEIYKKIKHVVIDLHRAWYKTYCGNYSDDFLYFICLLNYFADFEDIVDYNKYTKEEHQIRLNNGAVGALSEQFSKFGTRVRIDTAKIEDGVYYNQKGAKCYTDYRKHEVLPIDKKQGSKIYVLSVGFFGNMEKACATVHDNGIAKCYLLPDELMEWVQTMVGLSYMGGNLFPSVVEFGCIKGKYYAKLID